MDRAKRIQQIISGISVSASIVVAQQSAAWISTHPKDLPRWFPPAVAVIIYSVGSVLLRHILDIIVDGFKPLRRLLMGRQYIEGIWFDLISKDNVPISVGHSEITFSDGRFTFSGEDFRLDHSDRGHYRADLIEMSWPVLKYKYTYETNSQRDSGYGEAQFIEHDQGPPIKYRGSFVSLKDGSRYTFETVRIEDTRLIKKFHNDLGRDSTVREYLKNLINERSKRHED